MANYITLDEMKKHLNIDFTDDDEYVTSLIEVAQCSIEKTIQHPLKDCEISDGVLNPALVHAMKLLAGNLYANREPVAYGVPQAVPYTMQYLIQPFIQYT